MSVASLTLSLSLAAAPIARPHHASDAVEDRALAERTLSQVVSVTGYIRVPDGPPPGGGRWEIADESPFPGFMRHIVASGVVVGTDGTILCCRSPLVDDAGGLVEILDVELATGARYEVELLASEPTINLAVLRVKGFETKGMGELAPMPVGSSMSLLPTDRVIAIGDPFGSARTFAPGIVMALPATACYQSDLTGSLIHASMSIAPGSVGGALVNARGEAVGLLVPQPLLRPEVRTDPLPYVTYAMPMETALGVAEALKKKRSNESPWMGFSVLSRDEMRRRLGDAAFEALPKNDFGIFIDDIFTTGPGAKAGVRAGDILTEINGARIVGVVDFQQALYYNFGGTPVQIKIWRDGKIIPLMIRIETRPAEANRR